MRAVKKARLETWYKIEKSKEYRVFSLFTVERESHTNMDK